MVKSRGEKIFDVVNIFLMIFFAALFILPALLLVNSSLTATKELTLYGYSLVIRNFSLEYYKAIFSMESSQFLLSLRNSVFVSGLATFGMVVTTSLFAYALTRKQMKFKKILSFYLIIPMLFGGGTIPYYLIVNNLGLMNTLWALILPGSVGAWNILLVKNYFSALPESLNEAAELEGANNLQVLWHITMPLGFPIIATIMLYTMVGTWNDWFAASLFLDSNHYDLWPIQAFVRRLQDSDEFLKAYFGNTDLNYGGLRTAAVILSLIPVIAVYPFMQRFFIEGTMTGSVKE